MSTGGVKRGAAEAQEADEHPFRMAKPRLEVPPIQADTATSDQRLAHLELQVDSLNAFANVVEQTFPKFREMYDRMTVMETNVQNLGGNLQQMVAKTGRAARGDQGEDQPHG